VAESIYLTRYLNVPPARIPGDDGEQHNDLATGIAFKIWNDALTMRQARQQQVSLPGGCGHSARNIVPPGNYQCKVSS
jgi:hypothetical protein